MPKKGSQKNAKKQNSYSFRWIIDNIHVFIIKHKKSKLKLLVGGKQGVFNPKLSKNEKNAQKGLSEECQKIEFLFFYTDDS